MLSLTPRKWSYPLEKSQKASDVLRLDSDRVLLNDGSLTGVRSIPPGFSRGLRLGNEDDEDETNELASHDFASSSKPSGHEEVLPRASSSYRSRLDDATSASGASI